MSPDRDTRLSRLANAVEGHRLPAVIVDLDAFDRNVAAVAAVLRSREDRHLLRLATKSLRVPDLIRRITAYGEPYTGLMVYSAEEAGYLAESGFDDFLIAYPTVQKSDLQILGDLHRRGKRVRLIVDSADQLRIISDLLGPLSRPFELVIDVDMSVRLLGGLLHLGVRRSPVRGVQDVLRLHEDAGKYSNVKIVGLMGYEAQVAGLGDRNPFKRAMNPVFKWVRSLSVRSVSKLRQAIAEALQAQGQAPELFNGGGSGSLTYAVREPWLTEVTVGSGFLCSHLFDYYSNIQFEPAFYFALQVSRASDPGFVTCLGGGYIASGEPGWDKVPVPVWPPGVKLVSAEGCGEVQTPLQGAAGAMPPVGGLALFRHAKAGELAERFNEYLLVQGGRVTGTAKTYRGMGKAFL